MRSPPLVTVNTGVHFAPLTQLAHIASLSLRYCSHNVKAYKPMLIFLQHQYRALRPEANSSNARRGEEGRTSTRWLSGPSGPSAFHQSPEPTRIVGSCMPRSNKNRQLLRGPTVTASVSGPWANPNLIPRYAMPCPRTAQTGGWTLLPRPWSGKVRKLSSYKAGEIAVLHRSVQSILYCPEADGRLVGRGPNQSWFDR
jgi:hypothetical protein